MVIIVEGADGSGKSILCKQLAENNYKLVTMNHGEKPYEWLHLLARFNDNDVIVDRSFISDIVYRLWDNKPRRGMDLSTMCLILSQVKIIHCESGTEFEDSMLRGEDFITNKKDSDIIKYHYNIIMNLFDKFLDAKICKYNWHTDSVDKVINFIEEA